MNVWMILCRFNLASLSLFLSLYLALSLPLSNPIFKSEKRWMFGQAKWLFYSVTKARLVIAASHIQ